MSTQMFLQKFFNIFHDSIRKNYENLPKTSTLLITIYEQKSGFTLEEDIL